MSYSFFPFLAKYLRVFFLRFIYLRSRFAEGGKRGRGREERGTERERARESALSISSASLLPKWLKQRRLALAQARSPQSIRVLHMGAGAQITAIFYYFLSTLPRSYW